MALVGIIGGSGLDNPDIIKDLREIEKDTPYGKPSSNLKAGKIGDVNVILLARHGLQHTIPPSQVNNCANLWALKELGCTCIIATSAVGSLKENIKPGDLVILNQFIDFTRHRKITFFDSFEPGQMKHTPMANPFDDKLRENLIREALKLGIPFHPKGTVVTIEGPRFSTKAESLMFKLWGADVINMSVAPECILANELGIPYAAIAMSTDYDCWKENVEPVTWEVVLKIFQQNVEKVIKLITNSLPGI